MSPTDCEKRNFAHAYRTAVKMEVQITNGQNIIQLLSDDFASCLVIEGALSVNWPDCRGSIGEYYALSNHSCPKRRELTDKLNQVLIDGTEPEIYDAIKEFLTLFSNGTYRVSMGNMRLDTVRFLDEANMFYAENVPMDSRFAGAFYPNRSKESYIFCTVPDSAISLKRIRFYKNLIQGGARPKVITYELYLPDNGDFTACYLRDGHHKAMAYTALGMDIPAISITKTEQPTGHTHAMLTAAAGILKNFEFQHFLINNTYNLEKVNFVEDDLLTAKLDDILRTKMRPDTGIAKLFIKLDQSKDPAHTAWLTERLKVLSTNKMIGNGLQLTYLLPQYWSYDEIHNLEDFNNWINKVLPNTEYRAIYVPPSKPEKPDSTGERPDKKNFPSRLKKFFSDLFGPKPSIYDQK